MLEAIIGYSIGIIAAILRIRYVRKLEKQGKHTAWWHFWHDDHISTGSPPLNHFL